jgi:hypothetical protein
MKNASATPASVACTDEADEEIRRRALHFAAVEREQAGERRRRDAERSGREVLRVEERNDHDRADVVQDRERHQEYLESHGHAVAEQRQHAEREGDVGGGGNRPAMQRQGIAPVQPGIDRRGRGHAARRGERGEQHLRDARELALQHLALELQPDEEEEHRHQAVVDPQQKWLGDLEVADAHLDRGVEKTDVVGIQRGVGEQHRRQRRPGEQDAAGRFEREEVLDGDDDPHLAYIIAVVARSKPQ